MTTQRRRPLAAITGASGGIGEALAERLARNGHDVVLVARSGDKLEALGADLSRRYGVQALALAYDLSDPHVPTAIVRDLEGRGMVLDVLVNNAGFATYGEFAKLDPDGELRMLQVNVVALTHLTRLVLPGMIGRKHGRIMNVASTAAFMPGPLMTVYYASKAFVLSFSEGLNEELRGTGVTVTALCPGPTSTGFQARAAMEQSKLVRGRQIMGVDAVADQGYAGLIRGQAVVIPGLSNRLLTLLPRFLPRGIIPGIVKQAQERSH